MSDRFFMLWRLYKRQMFGDSVLIWFLVLMVVVRVGSSGLYTCPPGCHCIMAQNQTDTVVTDGSTLPASTTARKVVCKGGVTRLQSITPELIAGMPKITVNLDLSSNEISSIARESFKVLSTLQRLDLSNNPLVRLDADAFLGLSNLERLNLSRTQLMGLTASMFNGLIKLERLSVVNVPLKTITPDAFASLQSLRRLDIQSDQLLCDCNLEWFVNWYNTTSTRIVDNNLACSSPAAHRGTPIHSLQLSELSCAGQLELATFELLPSTNQIVFEGDKLPLKCSASPVVRGREGDGKEPSELRLLWMRNSREVVSNRQLGIFIPEISEINPDKTIISRLVLERLSAEHTGTWNCVAVMHTAVASNRSLSVSVRVIDQRTPYCPSTVTDGNRGRYSWPRTLAGVNQTMSCTITIDPNAMSPATDTGIGGTGMGGEEAGRSTVSTPLSSPRAVYHCDENGVWRDLNLTRCPYTSEMTRALQNLYYRLSRHSAGASSSKIPRPEELRKILIQYSISAITDKIDVVLIARILESFTKNLKNNTQIASILVDVASGLMTVNPSILLEAQGDSQACSRVIRSLETLPDLVLHSRSSVRLHSANIVVYAVRVEPHAFAGMQCQVYENRTALIGRAVVGEGFSSESLVCGLPSLENTNLFASAPTPRQASESDSKLNKMVVMPVEVGSITVPSGVITGDIKCRRVNCSTNEPIRLGFIVYRNSRLFPSLADTGKNDRVTRVVTPVISSHIAGVHIQNTSSPITVRMMSTSSSSLSSPTFVEQNRKPVYWDFESQNGLGSWLSDGCSLVSDIDSIVTFTCTHLTNFAVIEVERRSLNSFGSLLYDNLQASLITYIGSAILSLCLITIIIIYAIHGRSMAMSRKMCHAVVNLCLAVLLLCLVYTFGSRIQRPLVVCGIAGLAMHYLSLCVLLWLTIIVFKIYNKLAKSVKPRPTEEELLAEEPVQAKPIITGYLLGWGVAVIICGISGAINWSNYAIMDISTQKVKYCFLSSEAALLTLFVPAAIVGVIDIILFLRIFCLASVNRPAVNLSSQHNKLTLTNESLDNIEDDNKLRLLPLTPSNQNSSSNCTALSSANQHLIDSLSSTDRRVRTSFNDTLLPERDCASSSNRSDSPARGGDGSSPVVIMKSTRMGTKDRGGVSGDVADVVYRPLNQLIAFIVVLVLYCASWTTGALAVALPFTDDSLPHSDILFQCLYAVLASSLGAFLLVYFAIGRTDLHLACCSDQRRKRNSVPSGASRGWKYVPASKTTHNASDNQHTLKSSIGTSDHVIMNSSPVMTTSTTPLVSNGALPTPGFGSVANGHPALNGGVAPSVYSNGSVSSYHKAPSSSLSANRSTVQLAAASNHSPAHFTRTNNGVAGLGFSLQATPGVSNQVFFNPSAISHNNMGSMLSANTALAPPMSATRRGDGSMGTQSCYGSSLVNEHLSGRIVRDNASITSKSETAASQSNGVLDVFCVPTTLSVTTSANLTEQSFSVLSTRGGNADVGINRIGTQDCTAFYNARQNGAAKKYWERCKRKRGTASNVSAGGVNGLGVSGAGFREARVSGAGVSGEEATRSLGTDGLENPSINHSLTSRPRDLMDCDQNFDVPKSDEPKVNSAPHAVRSNENAICDSMQVINTVVVKPLADKYCDVGPISVQQDIPSESTLCRRPESSPTPELVANVPLLKSGTARSVLQPNSKLNDQLSRDRHPNNSPQDSLRSHNNSDSAAEKSGESGRFLAQLEWRIRDSAEDNHASARHSANQTIMQNLPNKDVAVPATTSSNRSILSNNCQARCDEINSTVLVSCGLAIDANCSDKKGCQRLCNDSQNKFCQSISDEVASHLEHSRDERCERNIGSRVNMEKDTEERGNVWVLQGMGNDESETDVKVETSV